MSAPVNRTPGELVQRTAGQLGGVAIALELAQAFDWFSSQGWTARQYGAVALAAGFAVSAIQNTVGHLRATRTPRGGRRFRRPAPTQEG